MGELCYTIADGQSPVMVGGDTVQEGYWDMDLECIQETV